MSFESLDKFDAAFKFQINEDVYVEWREKFSELELPIDFPILRKEIVPYIFPKCLTNRCVFDQSKVRKEYYKNADPDETYDNLEEFECPYCQTDIVIGQMVTCENLKNEVFKLVGRDLPGEEKTKSVRNFSMNDTELKRRLSTKTAEVPKLQEYSKVGRESMESLFLKDPLTEWEVEDNGYYKFKQFNGGIRLRQNIIWSYIKKDDYMDERITIVLVNYVRSYILQEYGKKIGLYFYNVTNNDIQNPEFEILDPHSYMLNDQILATQLNSNQIIFVFWINKRHHIFWYNKSISHLTKIEFARNEISPQVSLALFENFVKQRFRSGFLKYNTSEIIPVRQSMYDVFKTRANIFVFYYVISLHNGTNNFFEKEKIEVIKMDDYELLGMPEKFRWAVLKMICKKEMSVLSSLKSSQSTFKKDPTELTNGAKNTSFTSDEEAETFRNPNELSTSKKLPVSELSINENKNNKDKSSSEEDLKTPINQLINDEGSSGSELDSEEESEKEETSSKKTQQRAATPIIQSKLSPIPFETSPKRDFPLNPIRPDTPPSEDIDNSDSQKEYQEPSFSTESSEFNMFEPNQKINSKNIQSFQNFYQLLWYYYYYDREKYKRLWKEYERKFSKRILDKVGMDPNILDDLYGQEDVGQYIPKPTQDIIARKPSVSFSPVSPIVKMRRSIRRDEIEEKSRRDSKVMFQTKSSRMTKLDEVESSFSTDSDPPISRMIAPSPVVGEHSPIVNSRFAPPKPKATFSQRVSKLSNVSKLPSLRGSQKSIKTAYKPGFTMQLAPKKNPDKSMLKAYKAQIVESNSYSSSSRKSRSFKAIPNPANYKPKYSIDTHNVDILSELHNKNVKNYPELFNDIGENKSGKKDSFYGQKGKVSIFDSDISKLKHGEVSENMLNYFLRYMEEKQNKMDRAILEKYGLKSYFFTSDFYRRLVGDPSKKYFVTKFREIKDETRPYKEEGNTIMDRFQKIIVPVVEGVGRKNGKNIEVIKLVVVDTRLKHITLYDPVASRLNDVDENGNRIEQPQENKHIQALANYLESEYRDKANLSLDVYGTWIMRIEDCTPTEADEMTPLFVAYYVYTILKGLKKPFFKHDELQKFVKKLIQIVK